MPKKSRWLNSEKILCDLHTKFNIPVSYEAKEGRFSSRSTYDCRILLESPVELCSDSKFSEKNWRHNSLLDKIAELYCKAKNAFPVLFCRTLNQRGGTFTIRDYHYLGLTAYFLGTMTHDQVLEAWGLKNDQ